MPESSLSGMSDEGLRGLIRDGDGPERVRAAFELGSRLGSASLPALPMQSEPDAGVRRHWLTILASFGEVEAVRVVAEERAQSVEGEHAIALAAQIGLGNPAWFAALFNKASVRTRGNLLRDHAEKVAWDIARPGLEALLVEAATPDVRALAVKKLLEVEGASNRALREFAWARPDEGEEVLAAWAEGVGHEELLERAAAYAADRRRSPSQRLDARAAALACLRAAGRKYSLGQLLPLLGQDPRQADLLERPIDRGEFLSFFDAFVRDVQWVPDVLLMALRDALPRPWSATEERVFAEWESVADRESEREDWDPYDIHPMTMALVWLDRRDFPAEP